ncbi:MAG: DUF370 domain-containing protein [Clostridia bacterium]|nr:DUF370 domain-containing protein [Clostridia bacterium]
MLLHLGGDIAVWKEDVLAIFDYDALAAGTTGEFWKKSKFPRRIIAVDDAEKVKSIILLPDRIYLSQISSATLQKRAEEDI